MPRHIEETLQTMCVKWFDLTHPKLSPCLFHVPNGGKRNAKEAARFKAMGVRPGVPDLLLILPNKKYHFLAVELKIGKNVQTENQRNYQRVITAVGGRYEVVRCFDDFEDVIESYLAEQ